MEVLKYLTLALASGFTQIKLELSRTLSGLYVKGSSNPDDYGSMVYTGTIKKKIPQAYSNDLDNLGYMFNTPRRFYESDEVYRARILFVVKISSTKYGIADTIKFALEQSPFFPDSKFDVEIRESIEDYFDGVTAPINAPSRQGSLIGGVTVYITPKTKVCYVINDTEIIDYFDNFIEKYGNDTTIPYYKFSKSIDHRKLLENGEFSSIKELVGTFVAAGVDVDRIIIQQPGASGNKGEYYAY